MKFTHTQLRRAWAEEDAAWRQAVADGHIARRGGLNSRCLFRRGLISQQTYLAVTDPSARYGARWWGARNGRWCKRQLSKARRRAWRGHRRRALARWESECNWKGT